MKIQKTTKQSLNIMIELLLLQLLLARYTDAYLIRTEAGTTQVFALPDEQAVRLLFWVQEPDTRLNLTYTVMSFQYPTLHLAISETEEWHSAHFYYDRVYVPAADVDKYPAPASWWGRQVAVSSWEPVYWHLCSSPYQCSPGPPPQWVHQATGVSSPSAVSVGVSPTVVGLAVACGTLALTTLALTTLALSAYLCCRRRTPHTLQDARDDSQRPGEELEHVPTPSSA